MSPEQAQAAEGRRSAARALPLLPLDILSTADYLDARPATTSTYGRREATLARARNKVPPRPPQLWTHRQREAREKLISMPRANSTR